MALEYVLPHESVARLYFGHFLGEGNVLDGKGCPKSVGEGRRGGCMRIEGAHVLVTGGTGSIGSEVVRQLMDRKPKHITIFSRDDSKHFYFQQELVGRDDITFIIGDVRDRESLARAF